MVLIFITLFSNSHPFFHLPLFKISLSTFLSSFIYLVCPEMAERDQGHILQRCGSKVLVSHWKYVLWGRTDNYLQWRNWVRAGESSRHPLPVGTRDASGRRWQVRCTLVRGSEGGKMGNWTNMVFLHLGLPAVSSGLFLLGTADLWASLCILSGDPGPGSFTVYSSETPGPGSFTNVFHL